MDHASASPAKSPLILLLHAALTAPGAREAFENLLRTARVVIGQATYRELNAPNRAPAFIHAWLRDQLRQWDGPIALFFAANDDDLLQAAAKIGTLDQFLPPIRDARKVLLLRPGQLDPPHEVYGYPSFDTNGASAQKPLFLLKLEPPYGLETARELGSFLGTRDRPRSPTGTLLAVKEVRRDETLQAFPLEDPRTGQVRAVPIARSEPDDQDDRETIPPEPLK